MSSHHSSAHRRMNRPVEIVIVAAFDERRVIGKDGDLPWRLPADLRRFKQITLGHPVVMGRKTYESIGRPLPGRTNLVLSRNADFEAPGCVVVGGVDEAVEAAVLEGARRLMVIGGEGVFRQFLPRTDVMELTRVHAEHDGDVFFPEFDEDEWDVVDEEHRDADKDNEYAMTFRRLERKRTRGCKR